MNDEPRSIKELLAGDPWQDDHTRALNEARRDLWSHLEAAEHAHQGITRSVAAVHALREVEPTEGNTAAAAQALTGLTVHLAALRHLWKATR
jgi:hypothetical protein